MIAFLVIIFGMILIFIFSMWLAIAVSLDDFSIPTRSNIPFKNILVVYPHPDDESLTTGGLIHMLAQKGAKATLYILTKGERGTPNASFKPSLRNIRTHEAQNSAKVIGFSHCIVENLGDGQLGKKKLLIKKHILEILNKVKPDLVITYDRSGLYGHPDHMIVSQVVTELVVKKFKNTTLWYSVLSDSLLGAAHLPTHMAKNSDFIALRSKPTHKVWIGHHVLSKVRSVYCHHSQSLSFKKGTVLHAPLWFIPSTRWFEYFADVKH